MWTIQAQSGKGRSRRDFLRVGALALAGGLTQADVFRLQAQTATKSAHKAVIMIDLAGGPSHVDMYDMKPNAPVEIRGEFNPIATNVPGMQICELMPQQARIADKFSIVRGVRVGESHQNTHVVTGGFSTTEAQRTPAFGCFVSRLRGASERSLPPYVSLRGDSAENPVFLGPAYRPFTPGQLRSLGLIPDVTPNRLADRRAMLGAFDAVRRDIDARGEVEGMEAFQRQALELIVSPRARDAFDISREPAPIRDKYGPFQHFLLARRLVEAGVSVVTVQHVPARSAYPTTSVIPIAYTWDTHEHNFHVLRNHLPVYDAGVATLLTDLSERGLDRDVTVVICGEFGRSPRVANQVVREGRLNGRDHWPEAGFVLVAGGGLRMGQLIKDTGPWGERATTRAYTAKNVLATLYHALGFDPKTTTLPHPSGRPMPLLDDTDVIAELV